MTLRQAQGKKSPEPIGKTLEAVFKGLTAGQKSPQQRILEALDEFLDKEELAHIQPQALRDKALTLRVSSPARAYVLNLKKNKLLKMLQEKLGEDIISEIFLRVGPVK